MKFAAFGLTGLFLALSLYVQSIRPAPDDPGAPRTLPPGEVSARVPSVRTARPVPAIERAVVISVDGLRPDLLLRANTPNMHYLFQNGSYSFWARTTAVSVTLPSHTSMLTGATPNRHEILWNTDLPLSKPVYPSVPTLFQLAHRVGYTTAMVCGKSKFSVLNKPGTLDWVFCPVKKTMEDDRVADEAVDIIKRHKPQVLFVHFPTVDTTGHRRGWATDYQIRAIENADVALGEVLDALKDAQVFNKTFIILTADHGGSGRGHGPDDARSRHIPWIAFGPGIKKHLDLTTSPQLVIDTEDTFATVCWLLGIPTDTKQVDGKPIMEILDRTELLRDIP